MAKDAEVHAAFTDYLVRELQDDPSDKVVEVAERFLRNADVKVPEESDGATAHRDVLKMAQHRARAEAADA